MAWYAIVWREDTPRTCSINVPNFNKWCVDNEETLFVKLGISGDKLATRLVYEWNRTCGDGIPAFEADGRSRIKAVSNEYYARVGVVPEHEAPKMEYFGDGEWWWHYGDKEDGTAKHRTVLAIVQADDVVKATKHAEKLMDEWSETVEQYDTDEWNSDRRGMRTQYEEFREWVHKNAGIMPPELEPEPQPIER